MSYNFGQKLSGFTLLETMIAIGILGIIAAGSVTMLLVSIKSNSIIWDQLSAQNDARRVLRDMADEVRRSEYSSIGSFPIQTATTNTLTFYSNIDTDNYRERIRYFLSGTTLRKGVIKPAGNPLVYATSSERIVDVAHDVVNNARQTPVFSYFDQTYTGSQAPLTQPVSTTAIHLIRVQFEIEHDVTRSPVPLHMENMVQVRNLKTN